MDIPIVEASGRIIGGEREVAVLTTRTIVLTDGRVIPPNIRTTLPRPYVMRAISSRCGCSMGFVIIT